MTFNADWMGTGAALGTAIAPGIGTVAGAAAGGLAALAAELFPETIGGLLNGPQAAAVAPVVVDTVRKVVGTDDPAAVKSALAADPALNETLAARFEAMRDMDAAYTERFKAALADVADARKMHTAAMASGDKTANRLAWVILGSFLCVSLVILIGCGLLISGRVTMENSGMRPEMWVAVSGLVGAIVGYFSANAQQVVSFHFGSSAGSAAKQEQIGQLLNQVRPR